MNKIYIAARATTRREEVKKIQNKLVNMGYLVAYDWAKNDVKVARPYRHTKSRENNSLTINKMLEAAACADIFILLDEPGLRGAYIEYGAFLRNALKNPKNKKVFIVGPDSHEREHIFESPNFVYFVDSVGEVLKELSNA